MPSLLCFTLTVQIHERQRKNLAHSEADGLDPRRESWAHGNVSGVVEMCHTQESDGDVRPDQ